MRASDFLKRDDIRGLYPCQLNGTAGEVIGKSLCKLLQCNNLQHPVVAIGFDCRHGNLELANSLALGILRQGGQAVSLGQVSTEHIYYACGSLQDSFDAGVMITASHNPKEYNGMKFVHKGCVPFTSQELAFIGRETDRLLEESKPVLDFQAYARELIQCAQLSGVKKTRLKVVILAGNGMGGVTFAPIAEALGACGLEPHFLEAEPDGDFPNGVPNPLLPEFMQRLSKAVLSYQADLGIGFDGDADRAGFVASDGQELIPAQVLALIARRKLQGWKGAEKPVIMRNLCCSQLIAHLFGDPKRCELLETPVGHGRIKQLMRCKAYQPRTLFAGEHSGHYFYPEFHYVDSGMLTSLNMIALAWELKEAGKTLVEEVAPWRDQYCWSGEINFELKTREEAVQALVVLYEKNKGAGVQRIEVQEDPALGAQVARVSEAAYHPLELPAADLKMVRDEGASGWWFVARLSGNEPKLRLNVEAWGANAKQACAELTDRLKQMING